MRYFNRVRILSSERLNPRVKVKLHIETCSQQGYLTILLFRSDFAYPLYISKLAPNFRSDFMYPLFPCQSACFFLLNIDEHQKLLVFNSAIVRHYNQLPSNNFSLLDQKSVQVSSAVIWSLSKISGKCSVLLIDRSYSKIETIFGCYGFLKFKWLISDFWV